MIKTLEAQVGQFILGCKCPVSRFLLGRAKDLSAPQYFPKLGATVNQSLCITQNGIGWAAHVKRKETKIPLL
jgi:hypothetical protein